MRYGPVEHPRDSQRWAVLHSLPVSFFSWTEGVKSKRMHVVESAEEGSSKTTSTVESWKTWNVTSVFMECQRKRGKSESCRQKSFTRREGWDWGDFPCQQERRPNPKLAAPRSQNNHHVGNVKTLLLSLSCLWITIKSVGFPNKFLLLSKGHMSHFTWEISFIKIAGDKGGVDQTDRFWINTGGEKDTEKCQRWDKEQSCCCRRYTCKHSASAYIILGIISCQVEWTTDTTEDEVTITAVLENCFSKLLYSLSSFWAVFLYHIILSRCHRHISSRWCFYIPGIN